MEFEAITSQEQLDKVIKDRIARERDKFSDYAELKSKAAQFDQLEAQNATESQKTAKAISDLESKLAKTEQETMRLRIATAHGITDPDDIDLYLTGADTDTLTKQAKGLAEKNGARATRDAEDKKKTANRVPKEGAKSTESPKDDEMREFTRSLFGGGDD